MQLRDYQQELLNKGIEILEKHHIVYYALEMRLGKTFISLFTANHFNPKKVIFVTKKKAIENIVGDFEKTGFTWELICTNYESIHKIDEHNDADIIIFDEAHRLGGYPMAGLSTKNAKKITGSKKVIFLSGTPSPETESQLYHQFWVSKHTPFWEYSFFKWADEYVDVYEDTIYLKKDGKPIERNIKKYERAKKEKIFDKVGKYFVRYSQKDAGFEQVIQEKFLYVEQNALQKTICVQLRDKNKYKYVSKDGGELIEWDVEAKSGASLQSKFHQIHSGSVILSNEDDDVREFKILNNAKAKLIKEYFKGKKIAIFYKFQAELVIIKSVFDNLTNSQFEFNERDDKIFCGQITSCREGINLATADYLVFYNISFASLDYWQTINRFQAQDRKKDCVVYWIFSKNGIEQKIYDTVRQKKDYTLQYFKRDFGKNVNKIVDLFS